MHLGKFHSAITMLECDLRYNKVVEKLQAVIQELNNMAASPGQPAPFEAYKDALEVFRQALISSPFNSPYPTLKKIIEGIEGAEKFTGNALFEQVKKTIADNQLAPQQASAAVGVIHKDLSDFYKRISQIDDAFVDLGIEYTELSPGENEIGISIPVVEGSRTLKELSTEAKNWHIALTPFAEIFGEGNEQIKLQVMSSSDWQFYLYATPVILLGISACVASLNSILANLIRTKNLIKELASSGAGSEVVRSLEDDTKNRFKNEAKALAERIVEENYKPNDVGRKNELKNATSQSITFLAKQLDKKVTLEIRMELPEVEKKTERADGDAEEHQAKIEEIEKLKQIKQEIETNMESFKLNFDPARILALEDASADEELDTDPEDNEGQIV